MARTARRVALSLLAALGCAPDPDPAGACTADDDCGAGEACLDGTCEARADSGSMGGPEDAAGPRTLVSLAVTPADPSVVSAGGAMETVDFQVEATWSDGTISPVGTGFGSLAGGDVGAIDPTAVSSRPTASSAASTRSSSRRSGRGRRRRSPCTSSAA